MRVCMLACAIWDGELKSQIKSVLYLSLQKRDVRFTLQNAALRNKFIALRGFAIPLPPYRAFPPYFTFRRRASQPGGFFFGRGCDRGLASGKGGSVTEPRQREELNDAVEDAFGFNFRSLKTVRDVFCGRGAFLNRTPKVIARAIGLLCGWCSVLSVYKC